MAIYRMGRYQVTVRWPWVSLAGVVAVGAGYAWLKGWLWAALLAALLSLGILAGPGIDVERLSDLEGEITEYPDVPLDQINECFRERRTAGEALPPACQ